MVSGQPAPPPVQWYDREDQVEWLRLLFYEHGEAALARWVAERHLLGRIRAGNPQVGRRNLAESDSSGH